MFGWLFGRRINRHVFHYRDGGRHRSVDPVEVERVLADALGDDWRTELAKLFKPPPLGLVGTAALEHRKTLLEYRAKLMEAINLAFDVKSYKDGVGLTESERLGLLDGYIRFCNQLVRIARPFVKPRSQDSPSPETPPPPSPPESSSAEKKSDAPAFVT